jgi:hypothetical protein
MRYFCSVEVIKMLKRKHIYCFQISLLTVVSGMTPLRNSMYRELYSLSCLRRTRSFIWSNWVICLVIPSLINCRPTFQSLMASIVV